MYTEISILGVYVAPFAVMMLAAWIVTLPLSMLANRCGIARRVWHPGLFNLCIYVIILSVIVLVVGAHQ
ncbi:DUF1656 domain-containing protein [Ancylobacter sp. Lp-2]|uniref:DUF1656 domain-containing protein n=1 Tax=Ancylobacter sp. Lp-2 TaxID=2881339 RepID=UPI001E3CBC72|nr:DUF1656 domain-containing protein [Ancylobacter sp. Lp-2]MCB4767657.1 DUF1656 domain-containing protein [Ancylobacter sp. Lp-2]